MTLPATKRLFVSIEPPDSTKKMLSALDPRLRGVRWIEKEQMHLTLSFLGNVTADAEEALRERLQKIAWRAFHVPITGVGAFPAKGRPNVVWAGVGAGHPHLFQLHKRVQEAALGAGIEPDLCSFHPHITIGRCRDVSAETIRPFLRTNADFDGGMMHVTDFYLFSSKLTPAGSIHTRELTVGVA